MQNQIDFERLKESLSLNENEIELVKSLRQKKGEYSEAFLMAQDKRSVAVVGSTPLEYWIATTDPKDLGVIEADQKAHPERSEIERLEWLAKRYPRGSSQPQATEEKRSA
jgi:2,3-bisphosphoglycerate-independent phosphoglycerate mutase